MKAAITGATGFVGSHLLSRLKERNVETFSIGRGHTYAEIERSLYEFRPDVIFHLASLFIAEHQSSDIQHLIESNILFGTYVLEAAIKSGCQAFVNTGTSWQHFHTDEYRPVCLYAATKQAFEDIAAFYADAYKLNICTLKLFDTYGRNDQRPKIIRKLMDLLLNGGHIDLSPGDQKLCLTHVDDVVDALMIAAQNLLSGVGSGQSFAVAQGEEVSLRELVRILEEISGRTLSVSFGTRPYRSREVMKLWKSGNKLPGWNPKTALRAGLKDLWSEFAREHHDV